MFSVIEAVVQFDPIIYDVNEGETARLKIVLSGPSNRDVTVEVTTQDATALGTYAVRDSGLY